MNKYRFRRRNSFIQWCKVVSAGIISFIFMAIPTGISCGLYNLIDPITEIGRIISIVALTCIAGPFTVLFVMLGFGLFVTLLAAFDA